jgi:hypothetical protein
MSTIRSDEIDLSANVYMRQGGGTLFSDAANSGTIVERPATPRSDAGNKLAAAIGQRIADAIAQRLAKPEQQ